MNLTSTLPDAIYGIEGSNTAYFTIGDHNAIKFFTTTKQNEQTQ